MTQPIVINLSASALSKSACSEHWRLAIMEGYREKSMPARMVYGIAGHKFIDTMYKSDGNYALSIKAALEVFKSIPTSPSTDKWSKHLNDERHLVTTCYNLWLNYVDSEPSFEVIKLDNKPATEVTFRLLFYKDDQIEVYLCGTIDRLGQFKGGCFCIDDWKFTSTWKKDEYFKQYEMSRAFRCYTLALKLMAEQQPDTTLGQIGATKVHNRITGIFIKANANENEVINSDVLPTSDEALDEFRGMLFDFCLDLSSRVSKNWWHKEGILNGTCQSRWGLCEFFNVCKSSKQIGDLLLVRDFRKIPFNPLDYDNIGE